MSRTCAFLSLFFLTIFVGQHVFCSPKKTDTAVTYPVNRNDTSEVVLTSSAIDESKLIVYESRSVRILVGYTKLMSQLRDFIAQYNVPEDLVLNETLTARASERDTITINESTGEPRLIERLQFRLADMLESGNAIVTDRKTGIAVTRILVEYFESRIHKMAGRGGRRFYLPDGTLFLEIIDWMS